jgi:gliding motility-associated-like protein
VRCVIFKNINFYITMNKRLLLSMLFLLGALGSKGQYTQVSHLSGAQQYNCETVTVTQYGTPGSNFNCGAGPYSDWTNQWQWWGYYWFDFSPAVPAVRIEVAGLQQWDWVWVAINGSWYQLTSTNISPFPGTCNQLTAPLFGGYLYSQNAGTYGATIDIAGTISSLYVYTSGYYYYYSNNITYSVYFLDPNWQNVTASSNNPSCGQTLNLYCANVPGATSYSWTGPNNFTSNQQNPVVGTATYLQTGTYTVTVTTACGTYTASVYVNIVTPTPPTVTNSTINYCVGQTATALSATGSNLLWYTSQTGGTGSVTAPTPNTSAPSTTTWWVSQTVNGCESDRTPVTVNVYAIPAAPTVTSNSPVCSGDTISLIANSTTTGSAFQWTGPNSFTDTGITVDILNAQSSNAGVYSVTASLNGCVSPATTTTVVINPTPVITGGTPQNPTTCNGTNGQITLNGLTANTSYTLNYMKNNVAQTPVTGTTNGSGQFVLTGLSAGTYSSFYVVLNNCSSAIAGPFTLTDPPSPSITLVTTNSSNCTTPNGTITINGLTAGSYAVNYSYNGTPQTAQNVTITGNQIVLNNLPDGSYTNITVTNTVTNCVSNILTATIGAPTVPTIYATLTNPNTCNTSTGSILITGLTTGTSYTVHYTQNGNAQTVTQTATNGGVTISNLPAGSYTNIFVVINGCSSNVLGPLSLVDPSSPAPPVITSNNPLCAGQTLNLGATSTTNGVTYNWSGPNSFTSTTQNPTISNMQAVNAGIYSVTASLNNCSSAGATVNITVNPVPAAPTAGSNTPVCSGNNLNLTSSSTTSGVTYVWSGPNNFSSTQQNPTIPNVTTAATGTYAVYATANNCNSQPYTFYVNVVATPVITASPTNPSICGGTDGLITLSGLVTGSSYVINYDKAGVPQAPITQTATNGSVTIPNLTAATYTNITASLNGCPSNIVGPITLTGPLVPPTPSASSNDPLCEGDTLILTGGGVTGATYSWTGPNSFTANTQNASLNNVTAAAAGTYYVIASVNGCTSVPGTVNVVVNPQPATPAVTGGDFCEGGPISLTASTVPGVTYTWTGPNSFSSNQQNPTIASAQLTDNGVYTLLVSNGNCDASASANVTVNPTPGLPVATPVELCQNEIVQLTAQGQGLLWYTQANGGNGVTTMQANTSGTGMTTYYVSQTINGCEGPRAPLDVLVNPLPAMPTATDAYTYCQYETNVQQLTASGSNLLWYDVATGGTPLSGAPTPGTTVPGVFYWYVTQSDTNCESQRKQITVTVHPKPDMPVTEEVVICQDEPANALSAAGQNLLWYASVTGGTGFATAPTPNTTVVGTTDYYVSQTINGCESDRALLRITVNPKVTASLAADPIAACTDKPVTITFTGTGPGTSGYVWDFDDATVNSGSGAGPYEVVWSNAGDKTVTVTITNLNCSATATIDIDVDPTPEASFRIDPDACLNAPAYIYTPDSIANMPQFTWSFDNGNLVSGSGAGPLQVSWSTPGTKVVSLQLTGINCPSEVYKGSINIHHPHAEIIWGTDAQICSDDSIFFSAAPGLDYNYTWSPAQFFGKNAESQSIWGVLPASNTVVLTVRDRWDCEASDSIFVQTTPCCDVFLPNAFSPNGDGKNDGFRMLTKGRQTLSKFVIVNRWGEIVFETADQYEAWDGTHKGEAQEIGTYQYLLRYRCAEGGDVIEKKGDVILLR